ncbi:PHD finger protein MALE STERILITY 1 isoform X2 [Andrographis paniculata]|nr:PHD finger protein MALE STERILITY 1 isoform X2 [Andrographis paniculata]XP_051144490.1 PHD finger protein MALE STERILITY 1 isoform X2 [Andrographis paniculata]
MASWSFQLEVRRHPLLHLFLFVVEEPIELSLELRCKYCHYIGWGHHMICNKKYHFVLPSKAGSSSSECCKTNVIELHGDSHSLHGVFHSNGFGHLLCINGSEAGSDLAGYQIMEFWDRLCSGLGARKVSLRDVAKKKGMELRLLHTLAHGKPWFGRWDYTFGRGSYAVTHDTYQSAIKAIRNIPLSLVAHHIGYGSCPPNELQIILPRYQLLSGHSLLTLGDLFHFMLELKFRIPKESAVDSHYPGIMSDASCRWSPRRVEMAIHVVIEALKRAEYRWVSRQHVRDVARAYIGDTGLLDFVLKSLGNHMVGKYFVRRCLNPVTKVLEYCLEDISLSFHRNDAFPSTEGKAAVKPQPKISWPQLMKDMVYMYRNVFTERQNPMMSNRGMLATIPVAARIILDLKHLVKDYGGDSLLAAKDEPNRRRIHCSVVEMSGDDDKQEAATATPHHCMLLKSTATFDELKIEAERIFRETYVELKDFVASSIRDVACKGSDMVFKAVKPGGKVTFVVKQDGGGAFRAMAMAVDCICGAKEDDGERMVACDICQVWQHSRCVQIADEDEVPNIFLCSGCEQEIVLFPALP